MMYGNIGAICCKNHTEHLNTVCGQNAESEVLNLVVRVMDCCVYLCAWNNTRTAERIFVHFATGESN
jgi:hypothetical protein